MSGPNLTIAVTGLNATDNPGPGVAVVRAIRAAPPECRIVGLAYDALDPGNYMEGIADAVYLMPYPSQGTEVLTARIASICARTPIDVLIPCLDSELAAYIKSRDTLRALGVRTLLPDAEMLRLRSKARFHDLAADLDAPVPPGRALSSTAELASLDADPGFPLMMKGQFYEAYLAHTPGEARAWFDRLAAKWGLPVVAQAFVPGQEFDIAALGDGEGGLVGSVAMRKMQLTDKGKAWGGITIADPDLQAFVEQTVARLRWRGPCELEVMRAHDGALYLIEINPRFPAWIHLSVGAGRNLPWAAVRLALGETVEPMAPAPAGVLFLRHSCDQVYPFSDYQSLTTVGELNRTKQEVAS